MKFPQLYRLAPSFRQGARAMSTKQSPIFFGRYDVTDQVFHSSQLSFSVVNIKPLLPGHVLVVPHRRVPRLTDLTPQEVSDLFTTVQKVQRMLAHTYFSEPGSGTPGRLDGGGFNIAVQDGPEAGQSVPHVHCHVIPRLKGNGLGDGIYDRLASEEGNVGGGLWDGDQRPQAGGQFPRIEDSERKPRSKEVMKEEAEFFRAQMMVVETSR